MHYLQTVPRRGADTELVHACPVCDARPPERWRRVPPAYAAARCPVCDAEYLIIRLPWARLQAVYDDPAYYHNYKGQWGYADYAAERDIIQRTVKRRLQRVLPFTEGRRLLEVGAAYGFGLDVANRLGFLPTGQEISQPALQRLRHLPVQVLAGPLEENGGRCPQQDVVCAWDVVEHLYEPRAFLSAVSAVLAPGGLFAFTTPDSRSLPARILGHRWLSYKAPEHVLFLNDAAVRHWLTTEGLELVYRGPDWQYMTAPTLALRFSRLSRVLAAPLNLAATWPWLGQQQFPAWNGIRLYIARRT